MRLNIPALRAVRSPHCIALTMTFVAAVTAGCISGPHEEEPAGAPATEVGGQVEWWTINLQADYADYVESMIDRYEEENPGTTIEWVDVPGADLATKLLAALAAGDPPDAVNINSNELGRFQDSLADLNDYFTEDEIGIYQSSLVEPLISDGELTALPWYNGGSPVAVYRQSAMQNTSFDPQDPPDEFDDVLDLADEVSTEAGIAGFNTIPSAQVLPYYGIDMLDDDGTGAAFNTSETVEVLEAWKAAYDSGAVAPGAVSKDIRNLPENLENRRAGFTVNIPATQLTNIRDNAPEVYDDLVVSPSVRNPDGKFLLPGQQTFGIPSGSDNKATAAHWLKFVTSEKNQLEFCKIVAIFPSTKATLEDPFFETQGEEPMDQARRIIVDTLPDLEDGALGTSKDMQLTELFDEQVRAFLQGEVDAQTAVDNAETQWNTELQ